MALGLLFARFVLGMGMAAHGVQKAFGWFGGTGLKGTAGYFEWLGYRPGLIFAVLAGITEISSATLILTGFLGPVGPAMVMVVMLVVAGIFVKNGFFAQHKGYELSAMYMAAALALGFSGYGAYSLDSLLGLTHYYTPAVTWAIMGGGTVVGLINASLRRPEAPATDAKRTAPSGGGGQPAK
ncbi:MAG TPA: DoxX family protein [Capsulimonadaceae bacterium]|jgi:putative oxidoreductase